MQETQEMIQEEFEAEWFSGLLKQIDPPEFRARAFFPYDELMKSNVKDEKNDKCSNEHTDGAVT